MKAVLQQSLFPLLHKSSMKEADFSRFTRDDLLVKERTTRSQDRI